MILGLDLGASTGWALYDEATERFVRSGTWDLRTAGDLISLRCATLRRNIVGTVDGVEGGTIAYEMVRHLGGGPQSAHHYGALRAAVLEARALVRWNVVAPGVAAVKRAAQCGSAAGKGEVVRSASERWPECRPWPLKRHDEADARFCVLAAVKIMRGATT